MKPVAQNLLNSISSAMYSTTYYYTTTNLNNNSGFGAYESTVDKDGAKISIALPGLSKENVIIDYNDTDYTINIAAEKDNKKRFERAFNICASTFDLESASASMANGELVIKIPKKAPPKSKIIKIQ